MEGNIKYVVLLIQVSGFKSDMIKIIARECARACVWFYVMCLLLLSPQAPVARHAHHFFFGAGLSSAARARLLSRRSMDMSEAEALSRWDDAVGSNISKHSRAVSIRKGILLVEVDHPIWKTELHHRKAQILSILNQSEFEERKIIRDIFFVDPR